MFSVVTRELVARYPGLIDPQPEWIFNNAGGAMGTLAILHASVREYVIFFGTPIGTMGHTGRYSFVDDWFFMLDGEMWNCTEGQYERDVFKAGDTIHLPRRKAMAYRIPDHAWALEYARGVIPTMLGFGLADTVFSTLDYRTLYRTMRIYGRCLLRNRRAAALAPAPQTTSER
jgi:C-8 sterol isomerase